MDVAGVYRTVRQADHAVPQPMPRSLIGAEHPLDIRAWRSVQGMAAYPDGLPRLLVSASRKFGGAVQRVRFKRRVRMAALELFRDLPADRLRDLVLFVRPGRSASKGQDIPYADVLRLLRKALLRAPSPPDRGPFCEDP